MASKKVIVQKARAFELKGKYSYVIHLPDAEPEAVDAMQAWLKEQGIDKVLIVTTERMEVWETLELPNVAK